MEIKLPGIDYAAIAPMLIMFGVACAGVLVEGLVPRRARYGTQLVLSLAGLVAALVVLVTQSDKRIVTADRRCSCRARSWCSRSWRC